MKFNPKTQILYSKDDKPLKELNCPLKKNWNALVIDNTTPLKRYCNSCAKNVIDITAMNESQIVDLLKVDSESCFSVNNKATHIEWISEQTHKRFSDSKFCTIGQEELVDGCRVVKTARTANQINSNQDDYFVVEKAIQLDSNIKQKLQIQNNNKGYEGYDFRVLPLPELTNWWHPLKTTHPFAAYLVPKDVNIGDLVFVIDLIEDFPEEHWSQGDVTRLESGFGIFTGDNIVFDYPTDLNEVAQIMG